MKAFNKATNCSLHLRNLQLHNSIIIKFIYSKIILYCIKKQEEIPPVNLLFIICMIKSVSQCHKTICKMYIFHYYAFVYGQVVMTEIPKTFYAGVDKSGYNFFSGAFRNTQNGADRIVFLTEFFQFNNIHNCIFSNNLSVFFWIAVKNTYQPESFFVEINMRSYGASQISGTYQNSFVACINT